MKFFHFKHYLIFLHLRFENKIEIDNEVQKLLLNHTWPGNIFEIMNLAENITGLLTEIVYLYQKT